MAQSSKKTEPVGPSPTDLVGLLDFACLLADASGEILRPRFRAALDVGDKSDGGVFDPVTEADRLVEQDLRQRIENAFPNHSIIGEEYGTKAGDEPFTWLLDPIDGTRSFVSGVPVWGTVIAVNDGSRPIIGVVDQPYLGERFVALQSNQLSIAELRIAGKRHPLKVRPCSDLSSAILTTTDPVVFFNDAEQKIYRDVEAHCRLARYSMDCYGYCLLALGSIDLVIEAGLAPYDIQALVPIVEAAGGIITDWNGNFPVNGDQIVAAGDARVHAEALEILAQAAKPRA